MPGILLEESLGDPVKELVNRFHGPQEAANRQVELISDSKLETQSQTKKQSKDWQ